MFWEIKTQENLLMELVFTFKLSLAIYLSQVSELTLVQPRNLYSQALTDVKIYTEFSQCSAASEACSAIIVNNQACKTVLTTQTIQQTYKG